MSLNLRVAPEIKQQVEEYAQRTGISINAAASVLLGESLRAERRRKGKRHAMSEKWVAYDSVSGDVLADGNELQIRRYADGSETVVIAAEADWKRAANVIAKRMSGNPPRRNLASIEHL